jgi:hypothetical protein
VIDAHPKSESFAEFFALFPLLRDSKSIFRHYTKDFLMNENARKKWHNPDLLPLPI